MIDQDYKQRRRKNNVNPEVSVIIPTYNEAENISQSIDRCLMALSDFQTEIIVVDDDSPDGTAHIVSELYSDDFHIRVVCRTEDKGLAQSVTEGFRLATSKYVAVIDADLQHPPERLPDLFKALDEGVDIAVGSRHIAGGGIENWTRWRKFVSWGASQLARTALPVARNLSDPMSGFFAVRRSVVENVTLDPKGYKILLEILSKGNYDYQNVTEVPYVFESRKYGESKLTSKEYMTFLEHLLLLWMFNHEHYKVIHPNPNHISRKRENVFRKTYKLLDRSRLARAIKFGIVGGIGAVVNMIVFYSMNIYMNSHYLLAGITAFLLALNWNFIGNWSVTFNKPKGELLSRYIRFYYVSMIGFVVYSIILAITIDVLELPILMGNTFAIGGGAIFNFIGSERFVFEMDFDFTDDR